MIYYLIPARKGSKGWPGKNRVLFKYTAETLTDKEAVVVTTDDPDIFGKALAKNFTPIDRPEKLAGDKADIIGVIQHAAEEIGMKDTDIIVLLYLVHPTRTRKNIKDALKYFNKKKAKSLVCRYEAIPNPYECINAKGAQIVPHDFYRRQDFPVCYKFVHFVAIYKVSEICKLNKLAFNNNTTWLDIKEPVDIDYEEDFKIIRGKIL